MTQTRQDGGLVTFALKFYPDQPLQFPSAAINSQKLLLVSADSFLGSAVRRFEDAMTLIKAARIGIADLRNSLKDVYGVIEQELKPLLETRSEEHTSELQSLMRISYAVFCLKKKKKKKT